MSILEMEYRPISSWETSQQIMGEFFETWQEALGKRSLPGHFVHIKPNFSEYGLSDQYTSQHTVVQVLHWQPNAGTTVNTQILKEVSQCIESINGVREGRWKNTLTFYKPILREQANEFEFPRDFMRISLHEQPNKYYMGFQYQLGDFRLRVEKVIPINSENLRRVVMEMEYLLISSWETSLQIMGEFFDIWKEALRKRSLPGHFVHIEPNFSEYGLSDQYTSQHTAVQYTSIMAQMVATAQSSQAARN
ncbi:hypothetical protein HAX54_022222 [Datura stramonium]|uniref:Mediator of RNA polymerase II transcription subunit 20 n=1 Tax=Datura stramonium TaxID=4076 RepID=A0ABS8UW06_DATST|nr:hypothetical protein [Datura stramonium]